MSGKKLLLQGLAFAAGLLVWLVFNTTAMAADEKSQCSSCHPTDHRGELPPDHPDVGVPNSELYLEIANIMSASANGIFLYSLHENSQVTCGDCHTDGYGFGTEVQTATCLQCHGSYEELAELTPHPEIEEANPHKSHLGEVDCSVCHHAHTPSVTYCLQCHAEFDEKIPGS